MRLAIADPPYLGRAHWYTTGGRKTVFRTNGTMNQSADHHNESATWDDPETHRALIARLHAEYDGFAIALARDSLPVYLSTWPAARVCVWHNPAAWPPGGRIHATWEPVLVHIPLDRRAAVGHVRPKDVLTAVPPRRLSFIGAKPPEWTRWILDMLGYDPETDTVEDLFPGSGAVRREVAQNVIPL